MSKDLGHTSNNHHSHGPLTNKSLNNLSTGFSNNHTGGIVTGPVQDIRSKNTIKTVFLPNEQINNLGIEIDILKNQLETDKKFYEQEIKFLQEEKERRQNEF